LTILIGDKLVTNDEVDGVWPILGDDVTNTFLLLPMYEFSLISQVSGKAKSISLEERGEEMFTCDLLSSVLGVINDSEGILFL